MWWTAYFGFLLYSMFWCYSQYSVSSGRIIASAACVAITWFLIFRFTFLYDGIEYGPDSFLAAYADVIWGGQTGNWALTQSLLCWCLVASIWAHEKSACYQIFGKNDRIFYECLSYALQNVLIRSGDKI